MADGPWICVRQRAGPLVKECRALRPRLSKDDDPYTAIMKFNAVNAGVFSLLSYLENYSEVKNREIHIDTDMTADKSVMQLSAQMSLRVGQIVYSVILFVFETIKLKRRLRNGKQTQ